MIRNTASDGEIWFGTYTTATVTSQYKAVIKSHPIGWLFFDMRGQSEPTPDIQDA